MTHLTHLQQTRWTKQCHLPIKCQIKSKLIEVKGLSDRVIMVTLQLNKKSRLKIRQIYAPMSIHKHEEVDNRYDEIEAKMQASPTELTIVMGDFNAAVRKQQDISEEKLGKFSYSTRNERGNRILEFCEQNSLYVMNTTFKKRAERKWTWKSPDWSTKKEYDLILPSRRQPVNDVHTLTCFNAGSDHRMVRSKVMLNLRKERQSLTVRRNKLIDTEALVMKKYVFQMELQNHFLALQYQSDAGNENRALVETIKEVAKATAGQNGKTLESRFSQETLK